MLRAMTGTARVVIVDPQAQASWGAALLLELSDTSEDARGGALLHPRYCVNEACHCVEVEFAVNPSDAPLAPMMLRLELQLGKFSEVWLADSPTPEPPEAQPDQDVLVRGEGVSDEVVEWVHGLEACFDGETLDELWRRHLLARGRDPRKLRRRPPENYDGGNLFWSDVCPTARRDIYLGADDTMTVVQDDYCPNPTCTCREAHVSFSTLEGPAGMVTVKFDTGELDMSPEEGWSLDELHAAWDAYVARWPNYRSRLEERYERLRAAMHNAMRRKVGDFSEVSTPRRREAKVGRNEPCPCGSGRKYKRCCAKN